MTDSPMKPVEEYGINPMFDLRRSIRRLWFEQILKFDPDIEVTNINPDALTDYICEQLRLLHKGWPGRIEDVKKYMENELDPPHQT